MSVNSTCPECGGSFERQHHRQKYCREKCRLKRNDHDAHIRHREKRIAKMKARYAANRPAELEYRRAWHAENREEQNAKRLAWHYEHQEYANEKSREYRSEHADRLNAQRRDQYWADPEAARLKGRTYGKQWREQNPEKEKEASVRERQAALDTAPWAKLLMSAKHRAKKKGVPFGLTAEWARERWTGKCELTGIAFLLKIWDSPGPRMFAPSIDRKLPALGYMPDNCRFTLWAVNAFKSEGTDADMLLIAHALIENITKTKA